MSKQGPVIVVKVGGSLLLDPAAMNDFWQAVQPLMASNRVLIVHGAGPQMTSLSQQLGASVHQIAGRRVTGDDDLRNLLWAGRGELNTQLVASGFAHAIRGVGLCGVDAGILQVTKRPPWEIDGQQVDFGWVGDVLSCDSTMLSGLLDQGFVPIVASLGVDHGGQIYNVNADTVAAQLSISIAAAGQNEVELQILTDSGGVRQNGKMLAKLSRHIFATGVDEGWIDGGMRVKLDSGFLALDGGVHRVRIVSSSVLSQAAGGTELRW